jgi:hypothetical protein
MRRLSASQLIMIAALFGLSMVVCRPLRAATIISAPPSLVELIEEGLAQNKEIQSLQAQVESLKE